MKKHTFLLAIVASCALLGVASPAFAAPQAIAAAVVTTFKLAGTAAAVTTFVVTTALTLAYNIIAAKLLTALQKQQARQASILELTLGESPREYLFGETATGGVIVDGGTYGGPNGGLYEVLLIKIADHLCEDLVGYWCNDKYYEFNGDGDQPAFHPFDPNLWIYWRNGGTNQIPPAQAANIGWPAIPIGDGVAHVWVIKRFNENVWAGGRPAFRFVVRGALVYDPRLDDTVTGGSGPHRWNDPDTHEWSDNAILCRYHWVRGIYACGQTGTVSQLLVGRGLTAVEAPPERQIAYANICDEEVSLLAGGTEPRYRASGVIRSDEPYYHVEEFFASAMAGHVIQREGSVEVEPGYAKAVPSELEVTDGDLVVGEKVVWKDFEPARRRVNTVAARYIEPTMAYADTAAPVRRDLDAIALDGKPNVFDLALPFVTSGSQAQRCAEVVLRQGRHERSGTLPLGTNFSIAEDGDWVGYTSDRRLAGERAFFRIESYSLQPSYQNTVTLKEVSADDYDFEEYPAGEEPVPPDIPGATFDSSLITFDSTETTMDAG